MIINYSDSSVLEGKRSIFLAGPTSKSADITPWRQNALKILNSLNFDEIVYVPEYRLARDMVDDDKKFVWEQEALKNANVIVFWVPRKLPDMPAFSTNVEFGYWLRTNKIIYGRPDNAEYIGYLDRLYKFSTGKIPFNDLEKLLKEAIDICNYD